MCTINFPEFRIFDRHISNIVNNNIFVWLFIYFNVIRIKTLYIDNIIPKSGMYAFLCLCLWLYFSFLIFIVNIKLVLIHYLCHEMVMNFFVLLHILLDNSKISCSSISNIIYFTYMTLFTLTSALIIIQPLIWITISSIKFTFTFTWYMLC